VYPDGSVVLLPKLPAAALRGIIKSRRRRIGGLADCDNREMTAAAAEGAAGVAPRALRPVPPCKGKLGPKRRFNLRENIYEQDAKSLPARNLAYPVPRLLEKGSRL
jgi:hypothetical protein